MLLRMPRRSIVGSELQSNRLRRPRQNSNPGRGDSFLSWLTYMSEIQITICGQRTETATHTHVKIKRCERIQMLFMNLYAYALRGPSSGKYTCLKWISDVWCMTSQMICDSLTLADVHV